jgi:hypothetical protein
MAPVYISEGTQCTFLTLPGDVRSRIMEYALTSSAALHHVSPLETPLKGVVRPFSAVMAARLCAKRPILVDPQSETGDGVEFNQIKYVCRQAYAETAGHELRFNDIIIAGEDSTCKQLLQFGEYIGRKTRWLKNRPITLSDLRPRYGNPGELTPPKILMNLFPDSADMVAKTAWFCEAQPSITVHITLPQLGTQLDCARPHTHNLVLQIITGAALTAVLRGEDLSAIVPHDLLQNWQNVLTRPIKTMRKNWLGRALTEDEIRVPNLRYRAVEGMFDEAQEKVVREVIEVIALPWQKPAWRETMERFWVEQMRRWAESGI